MRLRVATYNILDGGINRENLISEVLQTIQADIVVLQEIYDRDFVTRLGKDLGLFPCFGSGNKRRRVALLSRFPVLTYESYHPFPPVWRNVSLASIEYQPGRLIRVVGLHPMANLWIACELWRWWEARHLIQHLTDDDTVPCLLAGDLNAIAPKDRILTKTMPFWLRLIIRLQGNRVYHFSIREYFSAGYVDCFRSINPMQDGFTLPASNPNARLDYILVNRALKAKLKTCYVAQSPAAVHSASDHCPVVAEFEL
jgi:exonuclease III